MISDDRHDLAIAYLLGELPAEAAASFEREVAGDAALAALVVELRETLGALADGVPLAAPSPALRERVLALPKAAPSPVPVPVPERVIPVRGGGLSRWFPAAVAAVLAVALIVVGFDDYRVRHRSETLRASLADIEAQLAARGKETEEQQRQIAELRNRSSLAEVKIATLEAKTEALAKANAVVVWDAAKQEGVIQLGHVPKPDAGKDYQLWVIDPKQVLPVNAGILSVGNDGQVAIRFKPDAPIGPQEKFAITVEKEGGVPKAEGPLVFIGG